jgi:acetyl esterase/lipase
LIESQVITEKASEFHLNIKQIAIGGLSAGGHISAVLSHMARDEGIPLALQILAVPCVDLVNVFTPEGNIKPDCPYDSYRELYWTAALPVERMIYAHECFVGLPRPAAYDTVRYVLEPLSERAVELTRSRTGN